MQRQIIVMFFSLFLLGGAPARAEAPAVAAAQGTARGALFKVDGGGHTLYLFGTMHVGLPEFYPLEPTVLDALAHASTLALEIDPLREPAKLAKAMQDYGMYQPGSAGQKAMPGALRTRLHHAMAQYQVAPESVAAFKPWLVATVLALGEFSSQGYRSDLAVDSHLAGLARAQHKPVLELESAVAQLALFDSMPEADQWRMLEESVDAIESGKQRTQVREIAEAWRTADRAALETIAREAASDTTLSGKFLQKVMLDGRNPMLAEKIAQLLAREPNTLAAIGVLHLIGEHSVPVLLRARGLTVQRLY